MIIRFKAFVATLLLVIVAFGPRNTRKDAKISVGERRHIRHLLSRLPFVYFVCFVG
jgi:hypothetical protein